MVTWPRSSASSSRDPSAVNTTDEDGNTPLHLGGVGEDTAESAEFMKFLLDHGAALDVANHLGFTPVYVTLFRNHPYTYARPRWGLFELLLARDAPYDINLACVKGDIDKVRSLLAADAGAVHLGAVQEAAAVVRGRVRPGDIVALLLAAVPILTPRKATCIAPSARGCSQAERSGDGADAARTRGQSQRPDRRRRGGPVGGDRTQPRHGEPDCLLRRSVPVHCMDIVTLAAVLHQNPKLALQAIYIPNPAAKEAAQALSAGYCITASTQKTSASGLCSALAATRSCYACSSRPADPNVLDEDGCCTLLHFLTAFPDKMQSMEVLLEFNANINARDHFFGFTTTDMGRHAPPSGLDSISPRPRRRHRTPDDQSWTMPRFGPGTLKSRRSCRRWRTRDIMRCGWPLSNPSRRVFS